MGWLFSRRWQTKSELVDHLAPQTSTGESLSPQETCRVETLARAVVGNILYRGVRITGTQTGFVKTYIEIYLLGIERKWGWGYKDMCETMGVYGCATCPLYILDAVPCPDHKEARAWREKVRLHHAQKAEARRKVREITARLSLGTVLRIPKARPDRVTVCSLKPLLGKADDGRAYRIRPRILKLAYIEPEAPLQAAA